MKKLLGVLGAALFCLFVAAPQINAQNAGNGGGGGGGGGGTGGAITNGPGSPVPIYAPTSLPAQVGQYNAAMQTYTSGSFIPLALDQNGYAILSPNSTIGINTAISLTSGSSDVGTFHLAANSAVGITGTVNTHSIDPTPAPASSIPVDFVSGPGTATNQPLLTLSVAVTPSPYATTAGSILETFSENPTPTPFATTSGNLLQTQITNPGVYPTGISKTVLSSLSSSTCTEIGSPTPTELLGVLNAAPTAQIVTLYLYDEAGPSPACSSLDQIYAFPNGGAGQVVNFIWGVPLANGLAYKLSAPNSVISNEIITYR